MTPEVNPTPVTTPAVVDPNSPAAKEAALKLEQLRIQVEMSKLDLRKKRRDDRTGARLARFDLDTRRNAFEKSLLELRTAQRNEAIAASADAENGEFTFMETVNWDTIRSAMAAMKQISRRNPGKPLTITLNSPGGSVIAGLALHDEIRDLAKRGSHHITTKCRGMAASMGGILLQAGDKRVIGAESMVLIHEVSSGTSGKVGDMEDDLAFSKGLWDRLSRILARRSKMTPEDIRKKAHKFDWWLSAEEALELGFADEIG